MIASLLIAFGMNEFEDVLTNQPVVIDNGLKMARAVEDDYFIGRKVQDLRELSKVKCPLEHGIVTDWEDIERI